MGHNEGFEGAMQRNSCWRLTRLVVSCCCKNPEDEYLCGAKEGPYHIALASDVLLIMKRFAIWPWG